MGAACCKADDPLDLDGEVELIHFELLRSVGKGAFGKVRIVEHKKTKKLYALKYINKEKCIKQKAVKNIIQERKILEEAQNPFICNLRFAFQDEEHMFMVLDLMMGGDIRFHLDKAEKFPEEQARFYAMEIGIGLAYLHAKNIIHRDIKPDNVLLDEFGHCSLTDFNIAVKFRDDKPLTATAGSAAYMAPEILAKKGYFAAIDWWSLGIMTYEMLSGRRPFRGHTGDELKSNIVNQELSYSSALKGKNPDMLDFLAKILVKDPKARLGAKELGGFESFKAHSWFKGVDWDKMEKKEYPVPFAPDAKKANYDATHELEELLLEENPLKNPSKKKKDSDEQSVRRESAVKGLYAKYPDDMKLMDEKFTVYDYTKPASAQRPNVSSNAVAPAASQASLNAVKPKTSLLNLVIPPAQNNAPPAQAAEADHDDHMEGVDNAVKVDGMLGAGRPSICETSPLVETMAAAVAKVAAETAKGIIPEGEEEDEEPAAADESEVEVVSPDVPKVEITLAEETEAIIEHKADVVEPVPESVTEAVEQPLAASISEQPPAAEQTTAEPSPAPAEKEVSAPNPPEEKEVSVPAPAPPTSEQAAPAAVMEDTSEPKVDSAAAGSTEKLIALVETKTNTEISTETPLPPSAPSAPAS